MEEYFPEEARMKKKDNEKEAAKEELREMGLNPDAGCIIS
jgi:transcriptional regulator of met regulon